MTQTNEYVPGPGSNNGGGLHSSSTAGATPVSSLHPHQQQQQQSTSMNFFINQQQLQQQLQQQQQQLPQAPAPSQQQQQFLPGPFYTLQQQQAFAQARLSAAAQAQQWQQKQLQQQQQQQQQGTAVVTTGGQQPQQQQQQQQVIYPTTTFSLVGNQPGGLVQQAVGLSSSSQPPSQASAVAAGGGGGLAWVSAPVVPNVMHSVVGLSIPTAIPTLIENRGSQGQQQLLPPISTKKKKTTTTTTTTKTAKDNIHNHATTTTTVASLSPPTNNNNNKSSSMPSLGKKIPATIIKKKTTTIDNNNNKAAPTTTTGGGLLLSDSIASITSGMCASAALLIQNALDESNNFDIPPLECGSSSTEGGGAAGGGSGSTTTNPRKLIITDNGGGGGSSSVTTSSYYSNIEQVRKQTSRDRNREHARCTRLRKKIYVNKLKELVDVLHTERNDDTRKQRVAVQQLVELQSLRRKVLHTFLDYHAKFENEYNKWALILECSSGGGDDGSNNNNTADGSSNTDEGFWFKQPVTPYRSFRRSEIQKGNRIIRGIDAMIRDSASMSVMIENIGSRNRRWLDRKRHDYLSSSNYCSNEKKNMMLRTRAEDGTIGYQISSSSDSSTVVGSSSSSSSSSSSKEVRQQLLRDQHHGGASNELHDYNAPSLLDPLPGKDMSVTSVSSSGDDSTDIPSESNPTKKRKLRTEDSKSSKVLAASTASRAVVPQPSQPPRLISSLPANIARSGGIAHNVKAMVPLPLTITAATTTTTVTTMSGNKTTSLPSNGKSNLIRAPAVPLPPFVGIGKKKPTSTMKSNTILSGSLSSSAIKLAAIAAPQQPPVVRASVSATNYSTNEDTTSSSCSNHNNNAIDNNPPSSEANIITIDNDTSSNYSSHQSSLSPGRNHHHRHLDIQANYHINEDDMILTDDVLMCPFVFKSQEAVYCGAHTECIQHGMLRATFSPTTNKLCNVEMIFDAMGFCQQLERASGNDGGMMAQIIPNSLEMALAPNTEEGRVITLADSSLTIVSVNEVWTSITGYTQVDAEGKDLRSLLHGGGNNNGSRQQQHDFENVTRGVCCASTNIHTDKSGRQFLNFMCSYPLSNLCNEVTHILHVCKEL